MEFCHNWTNLKLSSQSGYKIYIKADNIVSGYLTVKSQKTKYWLTFNI